MSEHSARALRPVGIYVPVKTGTRFSVVEDEDADGGAGLIRLELDRVFDFNVVLTIEDYGTLGKLIEALQTAQEAELERIKRRSAEARNARSRAQKSVRDVQQRRRKYAKQKSARERSRRAK